MIPLHVALVTPWNKKGGIFDYSERLIDALQDQGVTVTPVGIEDEATPNPRKFARILDDVPRDADVVHTQFEAGVFGRLGISGVAAPSYFRKAGKLSTPSVTTLHEVHETHPHLPLPGDLVLRLRDTIIERKALTSSDSVVVHTGHAVDVLRERHGNVDRVERLLHPVESDATPMPSDEAKDKLGCDGPLVLTFGWVQEKKRYEDVIESMKELPEVTYLIAGEPQSDADEAYLEEVLTRASNAGVADRVEHLGYVPESDVPVVFSAADVVVLPYNRVSQSGAVNFALAYRRPVVTSGLPAFDELRDEFGCLLTYDDPGELTEHVRAITSGGPIVDRLEEAAAEYTETITWDRFATKTIDIYRRITGMENGASSE